MCVACVQKGLECDASSGTSILDCQLRAQPQAGHLTTSPVRAPTPCAMVAACGRLALMSIAAPILQAGGTGKGMLIDSSDGRALFNTTGFVDALKLYLELRQYGAPGEEESCGRGLSAFASGTCLMTIAPMQQFKVGASCCQRVARGPAAHTEPACM